MELTEILHTAGPVVWLVIAVTFFAFEASTVQLVSIWFGIGALAALLVSFITGNIFIQAGVFLIVSIASLVIIKPRVEQRIKDMKTRTNAESLIGQSAVLLLGISKNSPGKLRLHDVLWTATAEDASEAIKKGETVVIKRIEGNKLFVEKQE